MELGPNQKKWVEALRSGKYKQEKSVLRHSNEFSCLGVACDIFAEELGLTIKIESYKKSTYNGCLWFLPACVQEHLGLISNSGYAYNDISLDALNGNGTDFPTIADILETKPETYFKESK